MLWGRSSKEIYLSAKIPSLYPSYIPELAILGFPVIPLEFLILGRPAVLVIPHDFFLLMSRARVTRVFPTLPTPLDRPKRPLKSKVQGGYRSLIGS